MFNFFTDTNEKTISQSSTLGGEEIGQDKETERKDVDEEKADIDKIT